MDINRAKLLFMKSSPEIMVGVGVALGIVAAVMACKATLHIEEELDKTQEHIDMIKEIPEEEGINTKKELTIAYIKGAGRIAKLYAPSVIVGAMSVGSILYGHNILQKRNFAVAAAYELMDKSYKTYRERVKEKFGEEVEKEIRYGLGREDIEYVEETKEGKEKKRSKKGAPIDGDILGSPYARKFNDGCINWKRSPERNLYFLRMMQAEANDALHARGHLFLNEVYDMLGFPRTEDGQLVGWLRGGEDVDFGIYTVFAKENEDFVSGYSPMAILDFNVDGLIYNKI